MLLIAFLRYSLPQCKVHVKRLSAVSQKPEWPVCETLVKTFLNNVGGKKKTELEGDYFFILKYFILLLVCSVLLYYILNEFSIICLLYHLVLLCFFLGGLERQRRTGFDIYPNVQFCNCVVFPLISTNQTFLKCFSVATCQVLQ